MISDICLIIITLALLVLVAILIKILFELQNVAIKTERLLTSLNAFVQADLHHLTEQTADLIGNLNNITANHSYFLLNALPKAMKWVGSSFQLLKTTKEFIKNYGK